MLVNAANKWIDRNYNYMDYMILLRIEVSAGCNYLKLKLKWIAKIFIIARGYVLANKVEVTIQIQNDKCIDWL